MEKTEGEQKGIRAEPSELHPLQPSVLPRQQLPTKAREEGELSQSDDDENPICSAPQSAGSINPPVSVGPVSVPLANQLNPGNQAGKGISVTIPASSFNIQSRLSVRPSNEKGRGRNRVPLKSANPGRSALSGANSNLVISFSDDDSDGEPENHRRETTAVMKQKKFATNGNQRMPFRSFGKPTKLQNTARYVNKAMPKNLSMMRTFSSSVAKTKGGADPRASGLPSAEKVSRVWNFNPVVRNFSTQEHGLDQGVGLSSHKLQDLRQQIAIRERELKLKATQQNKGPLQDSVKDSNLENLSNNATRNFQMASAGVGHLEVKEPERKRLKADGFDSLQLISDGRQDVTVAHSTLQSREQPLESNILQDKDMAARSESNIVRRINQGKVSAENPAYEFNDGAEVDINRGQSERSSLLENPCVLENQTVARMTTNSNIVHMIMEQPPGTFTEAPSRVQTVAKSCVNLEGGHKDKMSGSLLNNTSQPSENNSRPHSFQPTADVSEDTNIDLESLVEIEESLDKELEEAQAFRHACEIAERNALKVYRKAQRALIEANARCRELYCKRELYSSQFGSCLTNDSSMLWPSREHGSVGITLDFAKHVSRSLDVVPVSSNQILHEYDMGSQSAFDAHIPAHPSTRPAIGRNLVSEACSEPDASPSEPLNEAGKDIPKENGLHSSSYDPNSSADEDEEIFPLEHENGELDLRNRQGVQHSLENQKVESPSHEKVPLDGSQDSLILEAKLRSELYARLRTRTLSKNSRASNEKPTDVGTEYEDGSEKTQTGLFGIPFEVGKDQEVVDGGNGFCERNPSEAPEEIQNHEICSPSCQSAAASEEIADIVGGHELKSALFHVKVMSPTVSLGSFNAKSDPDDGEDSCVDFEEVLGPNVVADSVEESFNDACRGDIGSLTCHLAIDPFWPLCMYELRGKCNNDECPWQHVKNYSDENNCQQHEDSADCEVGHTMHGGKTYNRTKVSKSLWASTPLTYLVSLDTLKGDVRTCGSVLTWKDGQCWQKCFSVCLALSNMLQKDYPADAPLLHGIDGRIEVHGSWNKELPYFHSRNILVNHVNQASHGNLQTLEVALMVLGEEVNKLEGMKRALSVLSRAIEEDPTSEILWIAYLLIYHSNVMPVGNDDMFSYAVKHTGGSYVLWLMFINNRIHLDDRLIAYNTALTALCLKASGSDKDETHASACILDLFLQKLGCLCISGNVEKAIEAVYSHFSISTDSDEPHSLLLSDILACLSISDKHVFWICCVYLVIYRKLPNTVLQQFECDKELLAIDWPSVQFSVEEKERVVKLIQKVVDSAKLHVQGESLESEINLKSAHQFAVSHLRCMVSIGSLECCWNLLDYYLKLHPSCLELNLMFARMRMHDARDSSFQGFEEAVNSWPKEFPGINCIWNQYLECAMQNEGPHYAKELAVRWFNSIVQAQHPDVIEGISSHGTLESASASNPDFLTPHANPVDIMFGYLNLSISKLLLSDLSEAHFAINRALKVAGPSYIKHCVKELAIFLLLSDSHVKDGPISEQVNLLKSCLDDAWAFPIPEPLSLEFIKNIEKPRVHQLVGNMLCPASPDFSMLNIVLEVWYGPSLVPEKLIQTKEIKDLVAFVEAVLEILPSNYQFALSVCRLIRTCYDSEEGASSSILYWAISSLVNSLFLAIPMAPEYVWVEAAGILENIVDVDSISDKFFKRALSVYPFSKKLWHCFYRLCEIRGDTDSVVLACRQKGIQLG